VPTTVVGVYWSARADDLPGCTKKALDHFRLLAQFPGLDRWFRKAARKPKAPTEVDVTSAKMVTDLWRVNRTDTDRTVITELGWSLSLWNGDLNGSSASVGLHCGSTSKWVGNSAVVKASRDSAVGIEDAAAIELLKTLVELWDADTGIVSQSTWDEEQQRSEEVEIASYERRRWPVLLPKNAVRHANGLIRLAS
jgi:hypothetical protein